MELNPFERSFATKENGPTSNGNESTNKENDTAGGMSTISNNSKASTTNKHNLHIPNISSLNDNPNKLPGITPPLFTPGGRRLPPLGLSPNGPLSNPGTPGTNLWNSLLNATTNHGETNGNNIIPPFNHSNSSNFTNSANNPNNAHYNQFVNSLRKTGLTPNESNLRSGLTPGGVNHPGGFPFGHVPGLTTPSALLNSPMTPGLSSLLGMGSGHTNNNTNENGHTNGDMYNLQANNNTNNTTNDNNNGTFPPSLPPPSNPAQLQPNTYKNPLPTINSGKPLVGNEIVKQEHEFTSEDGKRKKKTELNEKSKKRKTDTVKADQPSKPAPKKKAAKKDNFVEKDSDVSIKEEDENEEEPEKGKGRPNDKRKNFLERNRVAASKCRQRKKQLLQKMEDELSFYSSGYRELSAQVQQLRDQLMNVRGVLVGHKDCSVLISAVGGYEQLNNIIHQTDYIVDSTSRSQTNVTSMPSTIPTTLNNANGAPNGGAPATFPIPPPAPTTTTMAPQLPINPRDPSNSNSSIDTINNVPPANGNFNHGNIINSNIPQDNNVSTRHSFSDLPAASTAAGVRSIPPTHNDNQGNLRVINSMSNLADMNQQLNQSQAQNVRAVGGNESYNLRTINSMVDLQHHNPHPQTLTHQNFGLS